jgi:hypothetical protein
MKLVTSLLTPLGFVSQNIRVSVMFQLCFRFVSQFCGRIGQHMADVTADTTPVDVVAFKKRFFRGGAFEVHSLQLKGNPIHML